jgi:hypothetical protein
MSATAEAKVRVRPGGSDGGGARLVAGLVLLVVAAAAAVVFLAALDAIDTDGWHLFGISFSDLLRLDQDPFSVGRLGLAAGALVLGVAALVALFAGVAGGRGAHHLHVLVADERGMVVMDTRGICTVASAAILRTPGVVDTRVRVLGQGATPVRLLITARISAAANQRQVADEARLKAIDAVERLVGVEVKEARVRVDVVPLEELGRMLE